MSALPVYLSQLMALTVEKCETVTTTRCGSFESTRFAVHGDIVFVGINETFTLDGKSQIFCDSRFQMEVGV